MPDGDASGALGGLDDGSGGEGGHDTTKSTWVGSSIYYHGQNGFTNGVLSSTVKGGTSNSGYRLWLGGKSTLTDDHGGGGGGYYGGMASDNYNGGGAGGSSLTNSDFTRHGYYKDSSNYGNGYAYIGYGTVFSD